MTRAERLARKAYEAYKRHTKAAGHVYAPDYTWDELSTAERQGWLLAAAEVVDGVSEMIGEMNDA